MTRTTYRQLQPTERMRIEIWKAEGVSLRAMARRLGRAPSTVLREISRNTPTDMPAAGYDAMAAQTLHCKRRCASRPVAKLSASSVLWGVVREMLTWKWSPQQIAATLKRTYPADPSRHVSHETIYNTIYAHPKGEPRQELIACLRQGHAKRLPRSRGTDRRGKIPEMVSIHVRPPEVEDRLMPGHWEGDLIEGAGNKSAVAELVERMSRAVLLAKMPDATAASALQAFTTKLQSLVAPLCQSMTVDELRPGTGDESACRTHRCHRRAGVLL